MAENVSENQLSEVLHLLQKLVTKSGDHDRRFDVIDESLEVLKAEFRIVDGKVTDVAAKLMEVDKRLAVVEAKLNQMETKLASLEDEARQIRLELNELNESAPAASELRQHVDQLEVRVFQLEEKLAN